MARAVKAAVFPVAGRGTRFLPATKASPKEMLPIVDKPLIQYAVEEAIDAGATKLIFITGSSKRAIEDHFDSDPELETALESGGKTDLLRRPAEKKQNEKRGDQKHSAHAQERSELEQAGREAEESKASQPARWPSLCCRWNTADRKPRDQGLPALSLLCLQHTTN